MSSQDSPWDQQRWSIHHESCVTSPGSDKRLFDLPLKQPSLSDNKDDPALSEWVVGVRWEKTFERDEVRLPPFVEQGNFASINQVCSDTSDTVFVGNVGTSGNYRNCTRSSDPLVTH